MILAGMATAAPVLNPLFGYGAWSYNESSMTFSGLPRLQLMEVSGLYISINQIVLSQSNPGKTEQINFDMQDAAGTVLANGYFVSDNYTVSGTSLTLLATDQSDTFITGITSTGQSNSDVVSIANSSDIRVNLTLTRFTGDILSSLVPMGSFSGTLQIVPEPTSICLMLSGSLLLMKRKK